MKNKIKKVLLIDDDVGINYYHSEVIKKEGVADEVISMNDGQEALDYLTTKQDGAYPDPELILLDINMPKMDGWEFIKEFEKIAHRNSQLVIIMLTTSIELVDEQQVMKNKLISELVNKPIAGKAIQGILKEYF